MLKAQQNTLLLSIITFMLLFNLPQLSFTVLSFWDATFHSSLISFLATQAVVPFDTLKGLHQASVVGGLLWVLWQGIYSLVKWKKRPLQNSAEQMAWQLEDLKTRNQCLEDENKQLKAYIETLKRALEKINA